jgi:hypothetical protein
VEFVPEQKNIMEKTAKLLRSQRSFLVQGVAGLPGEQGGGQEKK